MFTHTRNLPYSDQNMNAGYTFTFMHLADAFIQAKVNKGYACSLGIEPQHLRC